MRLAALALLLLGMPASAFADWTHRPSGLSVPDRVGDMQRGQERDLSNGERADVMVQYGTDAEPVTLYVYRSSHPNPVLWFERTRAAMLDNVGRFDAAPPPRPFTVGGAAAPNGLREEFSVYGKAWRATSVAMLQNGEWLVKVRVTSPTLDAAGVAARMDQLLAALHFAAAPPAPLPLRAPAACPGPATYAAAAKSSPEMTAGASLLGLVAHDDARGGPRGLSARPEEWCRDDAADPAVAKMASVYRRLDGRGWTALLGDAGMSASALTLDLPGAAGSDAYKGAGLYFTRSGPTALVATFDALPSVPQALGAVVPVLRGQAKPLATVGSKRQGT